MKLDKEYNYLLDRLASGRLTEVEKGLECKQFGEKHELTFLGFSLEDQRPLFHGAKEETSPATTPSESASLLADLSVKGLKELCDAAGIQYGSRVSKLELVNLLSK